jgi:hypothetical protein
MRLEAFPGPFVPVAIPRDGEHTIGLEDGGKLGRYRLGGERGAALLEHIDNQRR